MLGLLISILILILLLIFIISRLILLSKCKKINSTILSKKIIGTGYKKTGKFNIYELEVEYTYNDYKYTGSIKYDDYQDKIPLQNEFKILIFKNNPQNIINIDIATLIFVSIVWIVVLTILINSMDTLLILVGG